MQPEVQWTDEQMYEALQSGVDADREPDTLEQADSSAQGSPEGTSSETAQQQVQPDPPVAPEVQNTDLFEGTPINPDQLPVELQPLAKQLQAAFTQKTQQLAEERRQLEALGPMDQVQQAIELHSRITDPANWQQLHSELTAAMQQYGMTPAQASAAASEAMGAAPAQPELPNLDGIDDPELAPLAQMLKAQQAELDALKAAREQEQINAQAEYQRQAFLGELQRQENAVRAAHPEWDDDKVLAAYQMSSFFGGNLTQGAEALNTILQNERALYLQQKAAATTETGTKVPPKGAGTQTEQVNEVRTIKDAEAEALEFFNARMSHYDGA